MLNFFKKSFIKIGRCVYDFINNGGLYTVFALAAIGIICAIVGHYGTVGFHWKWFLFFELPLYIFCGWAVYSMVKMRNDFEKRQKKREEEMQK